MQNVYMQKYATFCTATLKNDAKTNQRERSAQLHWKKSGLNQTLYQHFSIQVNTVA